MRARIFSVLVVMIFAGAVRADEPWKGKAHTNWTLEDVQRILSDSPWVKNVFVEAPWLKGEPTYVQTMPPSCGRPDLNTPMRPPPGWALAPPTISVVGYRVMWNSAWTVRAAHLRLAVICKQADPDDDEEALENEPEGLVISVTSLDMRPFDGMDEDALKKNTYLLLKKTKQKVVPDRVVVVHGVDRQSVYRLTFQFPKTTDSGEPVITPDEKEIEFICQAGQTTVKAKFQPPKMVGQKGADL